MRQFNQTADCQSLDRGLASAHESLGSAIVRILAAPFELLLEWQERLHQRALLREMPDRMLKDLGLTRSDVESEAGKPVWRK